MKKIFDPEKIRRAEEKYGLNERMDCAALQACLVDYDAGEMIEDPLYEETYIRVILEGETEVFAILEDGNRYSLSISGAGTLFGETEFFGRARDTFYVQAKSRVRCYAVSIRENRKSLENDLRFYRYMAGSMVDKMAAISRTAMVMLPLPDRLINYMTYQTEAGSFTGLEKAAMSLHCSPRQLQRVVNELTRAGTIVKRGKGSYALPEGGKV